MTELVRVFNRQTGEIVEAELISDVSQALVLDAQRRVERDYREKALEQRSREEIRSTENDAWDWAYKLSTSDSSEVRFFAIDFLGRVEGLMMLAVEPQPSRRGASCMWSFWKLHRGTRPNTQVEKRTIRVSVLLFSRARLSVVWKLDAAALSDCILCPLRRLFIVACGSMTSALMQRKGIVISS